MWNKIKNAMYRFLYGRYGNDALNYFLLAIVLILLIVNTFFFNNWILYILTWACLILEAYRCYSRNIYKRSRENEKFLKLVHPITKHFNFKKKKKANEREKMDPDHRYFLCPSCSQTVRVPRGRGKIIITCPKCGHKFERKS